MFTGGRGYDFVETVEEVELDRPVYDINVDGTHNFVANGLVTHNSVYSFRGADIRNILEFERDFADATTVLLEQNYRSTQTVLDAANGLIAHNESQKEKHLWTDGERGRADRDRRVRRRARGGPLRRLRDQPAGRGGLLARLRSRSSIG